MEEAVEQSSDDGGIHSPPPDEHIVAGFVYEIDHTSLPPDSPPNLNAVRTVLVSEKTDLTVTVRFPRIPPPTTTDGKRTRLVSLDEGFVMGTEIAGKVLYRRIAPEESAAGRKSISFWLLRGCPSPDSGRFKEGRCWQALMGTGMPRWGFRRQVQFIGRHSENEILKISTVNFEDAGEEEEDDCDDKENRLLTDAAADDCESIRRGSKRLADLRAAKHKKQKGACGHMVKHGNSKKKLQNLKDRWSEERYRVAEESILEVLRENKAVFGSPILRSQLRLEARKKIGDTGLLDHLLKHMTGKVAPGGTYRFRRRHNPEGAIEYWLESADLVNVRKEAGIQDPYWLPPLGWQLGDDPNQDPICAKQIRLIKNDLATLKRDMEEHLKEGFANMIERDSQELRQLKEDLTQIKSDVQELASQRREECENQVGKVQNPLSIDENSDNTDVIVLALKAKKDKVEKQLMEVAHCLNQLEEDIERGSRPRKSEPGLNRSEFKEPYSEDEIRSRGESEVTEDDFAKEASDDQNEETARHRLKSGFRVCRPRGTFLWPTTTTPAHTYPFLVAPTPPPSTVAASSSSSSSAAAARLHFTPPPLFMPYVAASYNPPSPSERRAVKVATVTDVTAGVDRRTNIIDLNEDPPHP